MEQKSFCFPLAPDKWIGYCQPCFIIAEIGQNHQGDENTAKALIKAAKEAGVDCVKFQKTDLNARFTQRRLKKKYQSPHSFGATYEEHRKKLELSKEAYIRLQDYANSLDVCFTASGMDKPSIDFLQELDVPFFKIGSADSTNLPLILHASKYHKPLVVSTGMSNMATIQKVYEVISRTNHHLVLMQCTSSYPTRAQDVNLKVILEYSHKFPKAVIGYSGHEQGIGITIAAIACGAKVIERHITLDKSLKGSDHAASLLPEEFKQLVQEIRRVEEAGGLKMKILEEPEKPCYFKLSKTIVAGQFLPKGTVLTKDLMEVKVADDKGFCPINFYDLVGKTVNRDCEKDDIIMPAYLL